jgi:FAS-associated factor 2
VKYARSGNGKNAIHWFQFRLLFLFTDFFVPILFLYQNNRTQSTSFVQRWLEIIALVLRILLWPLRRAVQLLLPAGEFDGLSPAVTEKAAQHFVSQLRSLATSPAQSYMISETFSTSGFAALKQDANQSNSMIVVYLHSPLHGQATEMCQKLIQPPLLEFLQQDHIKTLGSSIHTSQGAQLAQQLGAASFPVMAILQPSASGGSSSSSSAMQLVFKAEGPALLKIPPLHLLPLLTATYQRHQTTLAEHEVRRIQREEETDLRRQQDAEYQQALHADQERERLQQEERDQQVQRIREEEEREAQETQKDQARLAKAKALIRPEPAAGGTRVRFVLASGQKLDRRFGNEETVAALKAFLILHFSEQNLEIKNIALSTNFPKKTYDDEDQTLQESGLSPQSVLMVQDLDA